VQKIHTDYNVADLLTKAFDGPRPSNGFKDGLEHGLKTIVREKVNTGIVFINSGSLLVNPVKQFWQTATASTLADGTLELRTTIDTIEYTITEASIRSKLQLADALGITMLPNTDIFEGQEASSVTQPQPSSTKVPPTPSVTPPTPSVTPPTPFVTQPTPPTTQPIPSEATPVPPLSEPTPPTPNADTTNDSPSPSPAHEPMEHTFEQPSTDHQPLTLRQ
ncbi:hypothetical protein Tco_1138573, partial [Tanacetum coccineum]